jgi:Asp-tRNA(Asn)/Glu-tRNA(Gln) amidotransferase A subunit family amidase
VTLTTDTAKAPIDAPFVGYHRRISSRKELLGITSYLEWMEIVYAFMLTGLKAISVPCGFTETGMPVGLQIVGRKNDDLGVLQLAHAFEKAAQVPRPRVPAL